MRISVVIPTYNRAHIVTRAVESALAQSRAPDEIIVVDDGSTDDTAGALRRFADRIRYITQRNAGVSEARNRGVREASCEWIAFLDSDDEWMPDKLATQVAGLVAHPTANVHAVNGEYVVDGQQNVDLFHMRGCSDLGGSSGVVQRPFAYVLRCCFLIQGVMARRDSLIRVGLFDPALSLFEDMDLLARLAMDGSWAVSGNPLVRVFRRGDPSNNLSRQGLENPRFAKDAHLTILAKLRAAAGTLNEDELRILRKFLSGTRFSLAAEEYRLGRKHHARRQMLSSMRDECSVTSLCRAGLGLVLGSYGIQLVSTLQARRQSPAVQVPGR